jgi:hypothetical protein
MLFSVKVNLGVRGNSILKFDLEQCFSGTTVSGVTTCTDCYPISGYNDVSWLDFRNGGLVVTGLTMNHPTTGLYVEPLYIKMKGIPAQGATCDLEDCFRIQDCRFSGGTISQSSDCTFSGGVINYSFVPDCTFTGGNLVYSV